MLRIAIVAGEASGDFLAATLIEEIRKRYPDLAVEGIGGRYLREAGCKILASMEKLAVMGLVEVAGRYPQLMRLRHDLVEYFTRSPPDVFIGVDAPDFNLALEEALHRRGIKTVHYVSPSVWAWRRYRLRRIRRAVDLMLTLFPFEEDIYRQHRIAVEFVGHPLADHIAPEQDKSAARKELGLPDSGKIVALMPGSRQSEVRRMILPQLRAMQWCMQQRNDLIFISNLVSCETYRTVQSAQKLLGIPEDCCLKIFRDRAHEVLAAADAALLTSGTVTLEAMLYRLPMVVGYRMNWLTYRVIRSLARGESAALPNLLAGKPLVAELLQGQCRPERMGRELLRLLEDDRYVSVLQKEFQVLHRQLGRDAASRAAEAVLALLAGK